MHGSPVSPTSFDPLDRRLRRRLAARSAVRIAITTVALIALYVLLPTASRSDNRALIELLIGLLVFAGLLTWMVHSIIVADHPEFRAIEALALAVPLVIVVFAFTYLSLSQADVANFSQPMDHVGAIYFTITVIGTVGFGDIVAKTDVARVIVSFQILLDLALVIGLVRTIVYAARIGVRRQQSGQPQTETDDGA